MNSKTQAFLGAALLVVSSLTAAQNISTVAGGSSVGFSGDGGPATAAELNQPSAVVVDAAGNIYIADLANNRIRKVTPDGTITTFAGNGGPAAGQLNPILGDGGPATGANILSPRDVKLDSAGNLYIAEGDNRVRKITPDGTITTYAGNGQSQVVTGTNGDGGPATSGVVNPQALAIDAAGNLYIADALFQSVRKVSAAGIITTIAGTGTAGFSGDGGPATKAQLHSPTALALDSAGNLYIGDLFNYRVRKVTPSGVISTIAGNGQNFDVCSTFPICPGGDGGAATNAILDPVGLAIDSVGNLFVADTLHRRIRKITPAGTISSVAGTGDSLTQVPQPPLGDGGPATKAVITPLGIAFDSSGNLFIAEYIYPGTVNGVAYPNDNRVREVPGLGASGPAPAIPAGGIVNGASFSKTLAPAAGAIVSLFGTNLAASTVAASSLPLPTSLGGVSVTVNGVAAPLFFVSAGQINFQIPWEATGASASVVVTVNGQASNTYTMTLGSAGPGIFTINASGSGQGAIQIANTATFAAPAGSIPGVSAQPVARGQFITVYCSGLGAVANPPADGAAASGQTTTASVSMTIGGVAVTPSFSGLAPGFVGLYQVNAQIPQSVATGSAVALTITVNGVASNSVTIAVQ